jgi:hypothetical protein
MVLILAIWLFEVHRKLINVSVAENGRIIRKPFNEPKCSCNSGPRFMIPPYIAAWSTSIRNNERKADSSTLLLTRKQVSVAEISNQ